MEFGLHGCIPWLSIKHQIPPLWHMLPLSAINGWEIPSNYFCRDQSHISCQYIMWIYNWGYVDWNWYYSDIYATKIWHTALPSVHIQHSMSNIGSMLGRFSAFKRSSHMRWCGCFVDSFELLNTCTHVCPPFELIYNILRKFQNPARILLATTDFHFLGPMSSHLLTALGDVPICYAQGIIWCWWLGQLQKITQRFQVVSKTHRLG